MTPEKARRQIVGLSLATTTAFAVFFILSPLFVQLNATDAYRLFQIVFPVFAGYLGAAVLFLFQKPSAEVGIADPGLLQLVIGGAFSIFWILGVALFIYYYVSNLPGGVEGMSVDLLSNYLTFLIAFMNITVGAMSSFLFRTDPTQLTAAIDRNRTQ